MDISDPHLERKFPNIKETGYKVTSSATELYNCIAWTIGRDDIWVWPGSKGIWPTNIKRDNKLSSFVDFYQMFGYYMSENDQKFEIGYEKVAIYIDPKTEGVTHAAKQTESGKWTSKIGPYVDVEHGTLDSLAGPDYGIVAIMMKRKIKR